MTDARPFTIEPVSVALVRPGITIFDGRTAIMINDDTPDSDAYINMSSVQRAVTITRLRTFADLLERAAPTNPGTTARTD